MSGSLGTMRATYQPQITGDTASSSYWLNWRVLLCVLLVLLSMGFASFLISKFEGPRRNNNNNNKNVGGERRFRDDDDDDDDLKKGNVGMLYADEVWKPCLKGMHPGWLLAFRVCAFFVLLILLIVNAIVDGGTIFFYYTQWTFTLVTIYFGLGSVMSMYGCYEYHNEASGERVHNEGTDSERGYYMTYLYGATPVTTKNSIHSQQLDDDRPTAGFWGYVLQIIFQMNAGAVMLTDMVFWFIIVPFLTTKNYDLNFFIINMHTVNLVFLLGDTALNCLHFPWFRIAYFILWTSFFVIFQWVLHACISIWWPYPFLDLSSSYAPLWYSAVAIMHIPCYGIFFLIIKLKHVVLTKYFPHSYQCSK